MVSRLHLVRHGRALIDPAVPSDEWPLDPDGLDDVRALREVLPSAAVWFASPERKAVETARALTAQAVTTVDALREQIRNGWVDDLRSLVDQAFAHPQVPAADGWESVSACTHRVATAVDEIQRAHAGRDLVLVGHGTAWTLLAAFLSDLEPDVATLRALAFPDVIVL